MRKTALWAAALPLVCLAGVAGAADTFSAVSVPQVSGYAETAMSIDDTMTVARQLASVLPKSASTEGNSSSVLQFGSYNTAQVQQAGRSNVSFVAQSGYYNNAVVQQRGSGQQSIVVQRGVGNTSITTQH